MANADLPKESLENIALAKSALQASREVYRGFRRQTLIYRILHQPGETWALGHCRLTALQPPEKHEHVLQEYPDFVYEDSYLSIDETIAWCEEIMTSSNWMPASRKIVSTTAIQFSHSYETDTSYRPVAYPCHCFRTGSTQRSGLSSAPLLKRGLPAYPNVATLMQHRFCIANDFSNSWLGEMNLYIPSDAARIQGVTVRRRTLFVKLIIPTGRDGYLVKAWARKGMTPHFTEMKVTSPRLSFKLPFVPESQVVFLLDKDAVLVDKKGDPREVNQQVTDKRSSNYWMKRILDGEGQDLELKNFADPTTGPPFSQLKFFKGKQIDKLAIEMASFANTNTGDILIGVEDDGTIRGVENLREFKAKVTEISHNNIAPPITPTLFTVKFGKQVVLGMTVDRSFKCHLVDRVPYIRRNASCRAAQSQELDSIQHPVNTNVGGGLFGQ